MTVCLADMYGVFKAVSTLLPQPLHMYDYHTIFHMYDYHTIS